MLIITVWFIVINFLITFALIDTNRQWNIYSDTLLHRIFHIVPWTTKTYGLLTFSWSNIRFSRMKNTSQWYDKLSKTNSISNINWTVWTNGIVTVWFMNYQSVMMYTKKCLYLWSAIVTMDSTASTLADIIASIVETLLSNGVKIVSVCTDNCNANKAALNNEIGSAQDSSNWHFIREPCSANTSNLAIEDCFFVDLEFGFVSERFKFLTEHDPKNTYRACFKPRYLTIRWLSLYKCICYIVENITLYANSWFRCVRDSLELIENKIGRINLKEVLSIFCLIYF